MSALLSVNINKVALLRNSRGHDSPSLPWAIDTVLAAGAHGITIHPRLDQRHIRFEDVPAVAAWLADQHPGVELNIECEPAPEILALVRAAHPAQCTLVPVTPGEVTSDHGWDLPAQAAQLAETVAELRAAGTRVSAFIDADAPDAALDSAAALGIHRLEIYTGPYAWAWGTDTQQEQTDRIFDLARRATARGLDLNAGHDLDAHNLPGLRGLPGLLEVSIGHALIVRALQVGMTLAVQELVAALGPDQVA